MAWLRSVRPVHYAVGIELVPEAAEAARAAFDKVITGSVEDVLGSIENDSFDLILALDVLEHLADAQGVVVLLKKKLSKNGAIIVSLPNIGNYTASWNLFFRGRWRYEDEGILDRTHLRFFDESTAKELLTNADMNIEKTACTDKFPFLHDLQFLKKNEWMRWQVRKLLSLVLPRHFFISQFLIRGRNGSAAGRAAP